MRAKFSQVVRVFPPSSGRTHVRPCVLGRLIVGSLLVMSASCTGSVGQNINGLAAGQDDGDRDGKVGPDGEPLNACTGPASVGAGRWRRLTAAQYVSTVKDLLGQATDSSAFVADSRTGAFKTNALLPVQENDVGAYDTVAKTLADKATTNMTSLLACDTKSVGEDKCATQFIKTFGGRAYRRPLVADEEKTLGAVYAIGKEESFSAGIRLVLRAILASPNFLYLIEDGSPADNGLRKLNGYEVASRLSYVLTGTMPDADLFSAAAKGSLDSPEGVRQYAEKLLATDKFVRVAQEFHVELLGVDAVTGTEVSKGGKHPEFNDAMRAAMLDEPRKFVNYVMTKGDGTIEELLSGAYVFPGGLEKVYGDNVKADSDGRAEITDGTRKGLLTLAGVQAVHPKQPSPHAAVNRGYLVRRDFLCDVVPPPTVQVDFRLPPNAEKMTAQELLREHQVNPTCKGCHELMDSIGFGFESYDAIGAYRTKDAAGNNIQTSGEIVGIEADGKFSNATQMAATLAKSPEVRQCMSTQWLRFALGRDPADQDACSLQALSKSFGTGKGNIKQAILSLVTSDSFRFNRGE